MRAPALVEQCRDITLRHTKHADQVGMRQSNPPGHLIDMVAAKTDTAERVCDDCLHRPASGTRWWGASFLANLREGDATVLRKGGKMVTIPLAPRTARAIDLAIGERVEGAIFLGRNGERLDHQRSLADRS